jgi:hypothetical protein
MNKYPKDQFVTDIIRFVCFFPFVATGAIFNAIPAYVSSFLSKKTDDPQFYSSIKYGIGNIIFPLYYLMVFLLPLPIITKVLLVITMPVLGILSYDYFKGLRIFWSSIKLRNGINQNNPDISRLVYIRSQIVARIKSIL